MSSSLACIKYSHPGEFCFQKLIINAESLTLLISAGKLCLHLRPFHKSLCTGEGWGGWPLQDHIHEKPQNSFGSCIKARTKREHKPTQKNTNVHLGDEQSVGFLTDSRGSNRQFSAMDSYHNILKLNGIVYSGHVGNYKPPLWAQNLSWASSTSSKIIHIRFTEDSYTSRVCPIHLASR